MKAITPSLLVAMLAILAAGGLAYVRHQFALQDEVARLEQVLEAQQSDLEASYAQAEKIRALERKASNAVNQLEARDSPCLGAADTQRLRSLWQN